MRLTVPRIQAYKCWNLQNEGERVWTRVGTRWAQFCQFKHASTSAQIGRNEGGGQSSKHERLNFASSSTCTLELAKTRGCLGKDRFDFAKMGVVGQEWKDSVLPI